MPSSIPKHPDVSWTTEKYGNVWKLFTEAKNDVGYDLFKIMLWVQSRVNFNLPDTASVSELNSVINFWFDGNIRDVCDRMWRAVDDIFYRGPSPREEKLKPLQLYNVAIEAIKTVDEAQVRTNGPRTSLSRTLSPMKLYCCTPSKRSSEDDVDEPERNQAAEK